MTGVTLSPKWFAQVLRDRGFPVPTVAAIEVATKGWSPETAGEAFKALRRIEAATDTPRDYELISALLSATGKGESLVQDAANQEPSTKPQRGSVDRVQHHIYATKGAITIELVTLRGERDGGGRRSIMIEAAQASAPRTYNWENKIYFSLMLRELPLFAAALLGLLSAPLVLANHGDNSDKRLELHSDADRVLIKVLQGKRAIVVPAMAYDCYATLDIALNALTMNSPHIGGDLLNGMLRRVAQMHNDTRKE